MFTCPTCGLNHHEGALFCEACGTYFHTGGPLATGAIETDSVARPGPSGFPPPVSATVAAGTPLILTSDSDNRRFVVEARSATTLLGRTDRIAKLFVDIDLTGEDGQAYGVSRRHARVHFLNGHYLLEDLESLNGTYLNERKLRPYLPEVLHDGDEVKLGSLLLKALLEEKAEPPAGS